MDEELGSKSPEMSDEKIRSKSEEMRYEELGSSSPEMTKEEEINRVASINKELSDLEKELEVKRSLFTTAEAMETQETEVVVAHPVEDYNAWLDEECPSADQLASSIAASQKAINALRHEKASIEESSSENSQDESSEPSDSQSESGQSTTSDQNMNSNPNTASPSGEENSSSSQSISDSGPQTPTELVRISTQNGETMDETFSLPIASTPLFTVLCLLYNWHKMGILLPLLYKLRYYCTVLCSYVFLH